MTAVFNLLPDLMACMPLLQQVVHACYLTPNIHIHHHFQLITHCFLLVNARLHSGGGLGSWQIVEPTSSMQAHQPHTCSWQMLSAWLHVDQQAFLRMRTRGALTKCFAGCSCLLTCLL